MKKQKHVEMRCPACGRIEQEKIDVPTLMLDTGKIEMVTHRMTKCPSCRTGLVRHVQKV